MFVDIVKIYSTQAFADDESSDDEECSLSSIYSTQAFADDESSDDEECSLSSIYSTQAFADDEESSFALDINVFICFLCVHTCICMYE
jgi:hypothetical protein